jgi:hypothetical protein
MVNTLRNFASTHHVSGSKLNSNIMPEIVLALTLVLLNLVLISSILAAFTPVTFTLILITLINVISVRPVFIAFCSRISAVADPLKTVFFEGVL